MAKPQKANLQCLVKIVPVLQKYGVDVAYLFGSRADGTAYADSDYDLAFLFKAYNHQHHNIALAASIQLELEERLKAPVDVVFLQRVPVALGFEIINKGIVFYSGDEDFRTDLEDRIMRDYLDFKTEIHIYEREVEEAIREGAFFT